MDIDTLLEALDADERAELLDRLAAADASGSDSDDTGGGGCCGGRGGHGRGRRRARMAETRRSGCSH